VTLYDSIDACCSVGMGWVDYSYCTSRSIGSYTDGWVVDFLNEKCIKDCDPTNGPPCYEIGSRDTSASIYDTVQTCCDRLNWISNSACVSASETSLAGSPVLATNQFFADYSSSSCLQDCEPGSFGCAVVPPPAALYDSIDACCSVGMGWVDYRYCMSRSIGKYTDGWVVDFLNEKCSESRNLWYHMLDILQLERLKNELIPSCHSQGL